MSEEGAKKIGKLGGLVLGGGTFAPFAIFVFIAAAPVPFVRTMGCSGTVEGAWLDRARERIVVAEHVWQSAEESYLYSLIRVRTFEVKTGAEEPPMFGDHFSARGVHEDVVWGEQDERLAALDLRSGLDPFASGKLEGVGELKQLRGARQAFISSEGEWIGSDDTGHVVAVDLRAGRGRKLDAKPKAPEPPRVGWGPHLSCEERCRVKGAPEGSPTYLRGGWVNASDGDGSAGSNGAWLLKHYERLDTHDRPTGLRLSLLAPDGKERWTFSAFPPDHDHIHATYVVGDRVVLVVRASGEGGWVLGLDAATGAQAWRKKL